MVLDGELIKGLQEAAEQEKGLRQRGKTLKVADPARAGRRIGPDVGGDDCGAEYG